jgi:hypothetical protein
MSNLYTWDIGQNLGDYQAFGVRIGSQTGTDIESVTASTVTGAIRYDSTGNRLRWSNGTAWQTIFPQNDTLDENTVPVRGANGAIKLRLTDGNFFVGNASNEAAITAKSAISLSGFGAPTGNIPMGDHRLTGLANAQDPQDAATLSQVQNLVAGGIKFKDPVVVATTGNIMLTGTQTIDTVSLNVDDRVLVKDQNDAEDNGIYLVKSGAWVRTSDMPTAGDWNTFVPGAYVFVLDGSANKNKSFIVTSPVGGTIDTDPIDWAIFSVAPTFTAGRGIVISGSSIHFAQSAAYTPGSLFFADSSSDVALTAPGVNGQILVGRTSDSPTWATLSGDATIANTGAVTVASGAITLAKMANASALSVIGNGTNSSAAPTYLAAGTNHHVLRRSGSTVGFGSLDLSQSGTVGTSRLSLANLAQLAAYSVAGNGGTTTGNVAAITAASEWQLLRRGSSGLEFGAVNLSESAAITGTLPVANGGTGITSLFSGLLVIGSSSNGFGQLGGGTSGQVLKQGATAPEWGNVDLGSSITGILGATNGGTGFSSYTVGDILFAGTTTSLSKLGIGSNQFVLKAFSGTPQWGTVETDGLSNNAVTTAKINDAAVTEAKINDNAVTSNKIASNAVTTAKINNGAVTFAKIQNSAAAGLSVIGRPNDGAAAFSELSAGSDHLVLRRSGNTIGFGAINLAQSAATTGNLPVTRGGTGLGSLVSGQILVGNSTNAVLQSSSLTWDDTNARLSVGIGSPSASVHAAGNIRAEGALISGTGTGTAPIQVTSRTRVSNLNVDQLDGADVGNLALHGGVGFTNQSNQEIKSTLPSNLGTTDYSVWTRIRIPTTAPGSGNFDVVWTVTQSDSSAAVGNAFVRLASDGSIVYRQHDSTSIDNRRDAIVVSSGTTPLNVVSVYGGRVIDLVVTRVGSVVKIFIDGVEQLTNETTGGTGADFAQAITHANFILGRQGTSRLWRGSFYRAALFNRALSAADVQSLIVNGVAPEDQWGTQTQLVGGAVQNGNFETWTADGVEGSSNGAATNWTLESFGAAGSTATRNQTSPIAGSSSLLFYTPTIGGSSGAVAQKSHANSGVQVGKRIRISFKAQKLAGTATAVSTNFQPDGLLQVSHTLDGNNVTNITREVVVPNSSITRVFAAQSTGGDASTFNRIQIDDFVVERIGAIIDLDLARGYGTTFPDRSTNLLDGVGSGDIVHLLPRRRDSGASFHGNLSGSNTTFTVTHNLGTQNLICQVWRNATPSGTQTQLRGVSVETIDANSVRVLFGSTVTGSNYRVAILALE